MENHEERVLKYSKLVEDLKNKIFSGELKAKDKLETKDEEQIVILEMVYEMNLRGIELLPIDIYKSKATRFTVEDGKLRPPFNAIAGLGDNAALLIEKGALDL